MTGKKLITRDTLIRNLPYSVLKYISVHLDSDEQWKKLIIHIPRKLSQLEGGEFEERYSYMHVKRFSDNGSKRGGSAGMTILQDWGTQNAQVKHLLIALIRAKLLAIADFLLVHHMGEERVSESNSANKSEIPRGQNDDLACLPCPPRNEEFQKSSKCNPDNFNNRHKEEQFKDVNSMVPPKAEACMALGNGYLRSSDNERFSTHSDQITSFESGEKSQDLQAPLESAPEDVPFKPGNLSNQQKPSCSHDEDSSKMSASDSIDLAKLEQKIREVEEYNGSFSPASVEKTKKTTNPIRKQTVNIFESEKMPFINLCHFTDNFAINRIIGWGGFGQVFLGVLPNGYRIAVKQLKEREAAQASLVEKQFETELQMLSKLRHQNIVLLLGYSIDGPKKCLVYEFMCNGSLEDRLACKNNTPPLPWQLRISIIQGTAEGITFLNNQQIVHRDIKSANVLLDENFVPKVGDFATVRIGPSGDASTVAETYQVIGTSAYMAPEAIRFHVTAKLDSFAFGVVLLEILTGLRPNDTNRSEADLWSYIQENTEDKIDDLLDTKAGQWDRLIANAIFQLAHKLLEDKYKKRVLVSAILVDLHSLLL